MHKQVRSLLLLDVPKQIEMNFSCKDKEQIEAHGLSLAQVEQQLERFQKGFAPSDVVRAARAGDGIERLSSQMIETYCQAFEQDKDKYVLAKFVPASGAASRMFKDLYDYVDSDKSIEECPQVSELIDNIDKFAFAAVLDDKLKTQGGSLSTYLAERKYKQIVKTILQPDGLDYGQSPKALILFHDYGSQVRTALEEHLVEAANFCVNRDKHIHLHFTISPQHLDKVQSLLNEVLPRYEATFGVKYYIQLSVQKSSTDTIAVNLDNTPARDHKGRLIFRPSGHGALIENLQETSGDIVWVKNIDNVEKDALKTGDYKYKKALCGFLLTIKQKIDAILFDIESKDYSESLKQRIKDLCEKTLRVKLRCESEFENNESYFDYVYSLLHRPVRVCSMVKNEGQPGGGPFWVGESNPRLQIVEKSQIDLSNEQYNKVFLSSTHFNPVDIVCSLTDHRGNKFELNAFVDENAGFISEKTQQSAKIKIQERPGLWNGAMAEWLTFFVETPIDYFNPVKTVNDLLKAAHRPL